VTESNDINTTSNEVHPGQAAPPGQPGPGGQQQRPARPRLPLGATLVAAARAGRHHGPRIIAVAIAVSLLTAIGDILVEHFIDPSNAPAYTTAELSTTAVSLLGTVFLSGLVCRLTSATERGAERPTLRQVARSLPWGRLILADLALVVIVIAGVIALVIPGLVAITLLSIVGPVVEIEDRKVLRALRRSAGLVRPQFWRCFLIAGLPLIAVNELEAVTPEPTGPGEIAQVLAIKGVAEGLAEAAISLVLVAMCFKLIALDAAWQATR
jgi:hypothetical protein